MYIYLSSDESQELRKAIISRQLEIKYSLEHGFVPDDMVEDYSYVITTLDDLFDRLVLSERDQEDSLVSDPTDDGIIDSMCKDCMKESCVGCDIINYGHKWYPEDYSVAASCRIPFLTEFGSCGWQRSPFLLMVLFRA